MSTEPGSLGSKLPHRQARFSLLAQYRAYWKSTPDFAGVRNPDAMANLSEDERKSRQALWTDVEAMLEPANAKGARPGKK